jgi:hypothetical protein
VPSTAFLKSRQQGELAQDYVAGMFRSWGLEVRQTPCDYRPGCDMVIRGTLNGYDINTAVEVKYDIRAQETGNLYFITPTLPGGDRRHLLRQADRYRVRAPARRRPRLAETWPNQILTGEFKEPNALVPRDDFVAVLNPKVLTVPREVFKC